MSQTINALPAYRARPVPGTYDPAFLRLEFQNVQRGTPAHTGQVILSDIRVDGTLKWYWCDTTNGAITVRLPRADQVQDLEVVVKKVAGSASVTIDGEIDGAGSLILASQFDTVTIVSSGSAWYLTSQLP